MSAANVDVSRAFITAVKRADGQGALDQLADDVIVVESGSMPHEGTFTGKAAVGDLLQMMATLYGGLELSDESFYDAGDFVVTRFTATFSAKNDDRKVSMRVAEHHWVKDGKINYVDVFYKEPGLLNDLVG